jgi:hypothetical protein
VSGVGGFVGGLVGLSLLEVVVSNRHGEAGRVTGTFGALTKVLSDWLDPTVPLIPNLANYGAGTDHIEANSYVQPAPGTKPRKTVTGPKSAITLNA